MMKAVSPPDWMEPIASKFFIYFNLVFSSVSATYTGLYENNNLEQKWSSQ